MPSCLTKKQTNIKIKGSFKTKHHSDIFLICGTSNYQWVKECRITMSTKLFLKCSCFLSLLIVVVGKNKIVDVLTYHRLPCSSFALRVSLQFDLKSIYDRKQYIYIQIPYQTVYYTCIF